MVKQGYWVAGVRVLTRAASGEGVGKPGLKRFDELLFALANAGAAGGSVGRVLASMASSACSWLGQRTEELHAGGDRLERQARSP